WGKRVPGPLNRSMKPVVETAEVGVLGGTAMMPVFTGSKAGRSLTASNRSHTVPAFPVVGETLKDDPTTRSKSCRLTPCGPRTWLISPSRAGFLLFHACKGAAVQAAAAMALPCKKRLLETDIQTPQALFS